MSGIHYVLGDATAPQGPRPKVIAHICNDEGVWGRGFFVALSRRDSRPEQVYRAQKGTAALRLGSVLYAPFGDTQNQTIVANMIAQRGVRRSSEAPRAVDYQALHECLFRVGSMAYSERATVHMPRIGTGLGGGSWTEVEKIVEDALVTAYDRDVYVYDLPTPEAVMAHHEADEANKEFQKAIIENAKRCSACGQPLPEGPVE